MKFLLRLLAVHLALISLVHAADDFSVNIAGKSSSSEAIKVGKAWRTDLPSRYRVTVRSAKDIDAKELIFRVYSFDADGKIVHKQDGPNAIWTSTKHGTDEVALPAELKAGQLATVYIAIPPEVEKSKALLVIFGSGDDLVYDIRPNSKKVEELEFPEKDKFKK